jgi:hypothetical protein
MPTSKPLLYLVRTAATSISTYDQTAEYAWVDVHCPHCDANPMFLLATEVTGSYVPEDSSISWLRCPKCQGGAIRQDRTVHPPRKPLRQPRGLPEVDQQIWEEARSCLSVGANAAAVMLCRKLLFHIAVANGLPPKNERDRAPGFLEAVNHLETEGIFTRRMRKWVDRIKDVGNDANHELTPITPEQALDVATFTQQLLILAYEMDELEGDAAPEDAAEPDAS